MTKSRGTQKTANVAHLAGGAADGAYIIEDLRFLTQQTNLEPYQLFDFFIADSVSTIMASALTSPHPEHPEKPRYTVEEYASLFYDNVGSFIPYSANHYSIQFRRRLSRAARLERLHVNTDVNHYDRGPMREGLKEFFGEARLDETLQSVFFNSQITNPGKPAPYWFTHLRPELISSLDNPYLTPEIPLPIYKTVLAATAFPTVFRAYEIEETGTTHIDAAAYSNPSPVVKRIQKSLDRGFDLAYTFFGGADKCAPVTAAQHNMLDFTDVRILTSNIPRAQIKAAFLEAIGLDLGENNITVFEVDVSEASLADVPIPHDLLDSRPEAMDLRRAYAQEHIREQREQYLAYAERLVENYNRRSQVSPTSGFKRLIGRVSGRNVKMPKPALPDPATLDPGAPGPAAEA